MSQTVNGGVGGASGSDIQDNLQAPSGGAGNLSSNAYLFRVLDTVHHDELRAKIHPLGPRTEEISVTIAEQWQEDGRAKGREEGLAKGRREGRIAALRSMLAAVFEDRDGRREIE